MNKFERICACQKCKMPTVYSGNWAVQQPASAQHNNKHNLVYHYYN